MIHRYIIEVTDEVKGFEKAIEKLEREWGIEELKPCEDAISRKEALECAQLVTDDDGIMHEVIHVDDIKDLPSVMPKGESESDG